MFISNAFASNGFTSTEDILATVIQLGLIFLIFYILLIRPQQKKLKQHNEMLMAVKAGDKIVTGGGIYAKVKKVDGTYLTVEIADGVEVVINRLTIRDVVEDEPKSKTVTKSAEKKTKKSKENKK